MRLTSYLFCYTKGGHSLPKKVRPRLYDQYFNNAWQINRERTVVDKGYLDACTEKGIKVYKPEDIFTRYLPEKKFEPFEFHETKKKPWADERMHPFYHERPVYLFNTRTQLTDAYQLEQAKILVKTVEIEDGLPKALKEKFNQLNPEDYEEMICNTIQESYVHDCTQKILPKNFAVPYIGWHSVLDKMTAKVPYEVTMSWNRGVRREYGIPSKRKNLNLIRGLFGACDLSRSDISEATFRLHLENSVVQQYHEKDGRLVRFTLQLPYVVTDTKPLEPYGDGQATLDIELPDISPMNEFAFLWASNIYNPKQNFPLKESIKTVSDTYLHTCVEVNNHVLGAPKPLGDYQGRALIAGFSAALGQARLIYGPDVSGVLPKPVTVHYISTNGQKYHFSVYQLNTLDLDGRDGLKNIFWHDFQMEDLFQFCGYEKAIPVLRGYNPSVFNKFRAMYFQ